MELGTSPEVEVISPARPGRRRRYTADEKRRIVEETKAPGQSVSAVSRRYGVSPSQVFKWRRLVEEGTMSSLGADEPVVPESEVKSPAHSSTLPRRPSAFQPTMRSSSVGKKSLFVHS